MVTTGSASISTLRGGSGPPLLLLHDQPQKTHVASYQIAGALAEHCSVVLTNLRRYDDSSKPDGGPDHVNYAARGRETRLK